MNTLRSTLYGLFWDAVATVLGIMWTVGIHLAIACRLLDNHQGSSAQKQQHLGQSPRKRLSVASTQKSRLGYRGRVV